jgi:hypothetical protein
MLADPDAPGVPFAAVLDVNPLGDGDLVLTDLTPAKRLVLPSGWFGGPDRCVDGVYPRDLRAWTAPGADALAALADTLAEWAGPRGWTVCFRPHARHVLSDPQRVLSFLRGRESGPFEILLDPAAMLTASMLGAAGDHLRRAADALGGHPRVCAVAVSGVEVVRGPDGSDECRPCALGRGSIEAAVIADALGPALSRKPVVLSAEGLGEQRALLSTLAGM